MEKIRYVKGRRGGYKSADQADQGVMTFAHSWNGATDPTADEGAKIIADLAALDTLLTAIRTALVEAGIMKGEA